MPRSAVGSTRASSSHSTRAASSRSEGRQGGGGGGGGGVSIWDVAVNEGRKRRQDLVNDTERTSREATVMLVGTRGAGKTTLLQKFLDREETARHTLALEYTYGRKTGRTLVKDVCHLWELGGGSLFTPLLSTPLTPRILPRLSFVLVLDLSHPQTLWTDLVTLLAALKEEVGKAASSVPGLRASLEAAAVKRLQAGANTLEAEVKPFLVPLVIVGGKYDVFQNLEPEGKKMICRALRFVAHTHGASLQFFSARDPGLVKKAKELLSHLAFGTAESRNLAQDYNKPLIIPAASDTLAAINLNEDLTLDTWGHKFTAKYPQERQEGSSAMPEDPARDPTYAEPDVDNLRAQKDEELERIRREVGRNAARWADLDLT
ncbi:cytoplasmic dynein 2 light intermediate chain 1-like [Eriocheir sinensis]|uniref:cytoplasmic dynein 2 light intermediate chain 1-like n=1 Tax=Eriocheir sinensis TaxID=95602 RepID=UPI0021C69609|nr:cytoplasmic dynein 2 light intermediate chain 1-like [Eriocheir sinensis]